MSRSRYFSFLIAVPLVVALALPGAAEATFPGENGKIAFSGCGPEDCGVIAVNADGSERTQITHNPFTYPECSRFGCSSDLAKTSTPIGRRTAGTCPSPAMATSTGFVRTAVASPS